jgi:hypothetical protein
VGDDRDERIRSVAEGRTVIGVDHLSRGEGARRQDERQLGMR